MPASDPTCAKGRVERVVMLRRRPQGFQEGRASCSRQHSGRASTRAWLSVTAQAGQDTVWQAGHRLWVALQVCNTARVSEQRGTAWGA